MFVSTGEGLLNSESIARLERLPKGRTLVRLMDGQSITLDQEYDDLVRRFGPVIPEVSGTKALFMGYEGGEFYHFVEPILGWIITALGPEPILTDGNDAPYLLFADGSVQQPFVGRFDSLDQAIQDYKQANPAKPR